MFWSILWIIFYVLYVLLRRLFGVILHVEHCLVDSRLIIFIYISAFEFKLLICIKSAKVRKYNNIIVYNII